ncbi:MAG: RsmB/NOP family class I SAM-dependent RNA methyltransferase [Verrucomicrobiota bacterium]|nr:RsmB/NOP family class I SAM-dependent RNA methyltransferase [Verrucomicrobiota bacterium]
MKPHLQEAIRILEQVAPNRPLDAAIRDYFRKNRTINPGLRASISETLFAHSRWNGWIDPNLPIHGQLAAGMDFERRWQTEPETFTPAEILSNAIPRWITAELALPEQPPATRVQFLQEWTRSLQTPAPLWIRAKSSSTSEIEALRYFYPGPFPNSFQYKGPDDLFRSAPFKEGSLEIQDISSQVVGHVCAPNPGETWWDACAGEGGKTLHLADLMQNKGLLWATDPAEWRLDNLKKRAGRAKVFNYRQRQWKGEPPLPFKTPCDGILVDAPCSGVGTWQRNPHARWTTTKQDILELAEIQKRLLKLVVDNLKPGGKLIYSVCTLTRAETTDVVEFVRNEIPRLGPLPLKLPIGLSTPTGGWLWPQTIHGNGMFLYAWRKLPE